MHDDNSNAQKHSETDADDPTFNKHPRSADNIRRKHSHAQNVERNSLECKKHDDDHNLMNLEKPPNMKQDVWSDPYKISDITDDSDSK